jgi:hypothetical protein
MKYFPNYEEEYVFEAFPVPYYKDVKEYPTTLVLSSLIDLSIKQLNPVGGCLLYKGAMVSFLRGSRRKVIELESYYRKIEEIEAAKMFIFQKFRRYTSSDIFYTGVSAEEARNFKQAVALVEQQNVE